MNFDVQGHLDAVDRSVSSLEREGQDAHAPTLSRSYATTLDDLWEAMTNADRIPRWSMPITGDLELGGRYQLEGNAGGTIIACEPLSHIALTWEFAGDVSWVDIRFSDEGAGLARLTLMHTSLHSPHWDEYGPGATGVGWELALLGLALHIADPTAPMPDEVGVRYLARRQGDHHRQQRGLGPSRRRRRDRPGSRPRGRNAHDGILHRRIR